MFYVSAHRLDPPLRLREMKRNTRLLIANFLLAPRIVSLREQSNSRHRIAEMFVGQRVSGFCADKGEVIAD